MRSIRSTADKKKDQTKSVNKDDSHSMETSTISSLTIDMESGNENNLGDLSNFPLEIILHILQFMPEKELKQSIPLVSKYFNDIFKCNFINSYKRTIKCLRWHDDEVNNFDKRIQKFMSEYTVRVYNRPDLNERNKKSYYQETFSLLFMASGILALSYKAFISTPAPEEITQVRMLRFAAAFALVALIIIMILKYAVLSTENKLFHLRRINQSDINRVKLLLNESENLLSPDEINSKLQLNVTKREEVFSMLKIALQGVKDNAKQLNEHLLGLRLSRHDFFDLERDLAGLKDPKTKIYGRKILSIWTSTINKASEDTNKGLVPNASRPKRD